MPRRAIIKLLDQSPRLRAATMTAERWRLSLRLEVLHRFQRATPVIIFQMGKVGSSSVAASFPTDRYPLAIQTHHLHPPQIEAMTQLQRQRGQPVRRHYGRASVASRRVIETGRPYKLITLVREPISRAMSHFFQNLDTFVGPPQGATGHPIEELQRIFVDRYAQLNQLYWFEREFEPALGIDVYAHPFPHGDGHLRIPTVHGEVLILRLEMADTEKETAIRAFLDDPSFVLGSANTAETKEYADLYQGFKDRLVLPLDHVDRMLESRYARHFYSDAERQATRARWVARADQYSR